MISIEWAMNRKVLKSRYALIPRAERMPSRSRATSMRLLATDLPGKKLEKVRVFSNGRFGYTIFRSCPSVIGSVLNGKY